MPIKWEPAIYEHKAALIGCSPAEIANSVELLTGAVLREYEIYQSDYITVGVDVYNIEAEALGAGLTAPEKNECPDLAVTLYDLNQLPAQLTLPEIPAAGRFKLLLEAGKNVQNAIGDKTKVRVAASGPVSMAAKLTGLEDLIMSLMLEDGNAVRLLEIIGKIYNIVSLRAYMEQDEIEAVLQEKRTQLNSLITLCAERGYKGCESYLTNARPYMFSALEKRLNGKSSSLAERVMRTVNMRVNVGKWTPQGALNAMNLRLAHYYNDWRPEEPAAKGVKIVRL